MCSLQCFCWTVLTWSTNPWTEALTKLPWGREDRRRKQQKQERFSNKRTELVDLISQSNLTDRFFVRPCAVMEEQRNYSKYSAPPPGVYEVLWTPAE